MWNSSARRICGTVTLHYIRARGVVLGERFDMAVGRREWDVWQRAARDEDETISSSPHNANANCSICELEGIDGCFGYVEVHTVIILFVG